MSILSEIEDVLGEELGPPSRWPAVADLRIGVYMAGILLEGGVAGVAYVPHVSSHGSQCLLSPSLTTVVPGTLSAQPVEYLLALRERGDPVLSSVGMAAMNALSSLAMSRSRRAELLRASGDPAEPLELLSPAAEDIVGLVGAMTPYIDRLAGRVRNIHLFEQKSDTVREEHAQWLRPQEGMAQLLPQCTVVVITGAALTNQSLEKLLPHCTGAREVAVVGPSASVVPEPLFEHGVTVVGGVEVTAPALMLRIVSEGGSGRSLDARCMRKRTFRRQKG